MSETKHTPGPWSRSWVYGAIRHINKNVDSDAFWLPDDGEDPDTANCPNVRSFPADADLIAAAPDLLAALKGILPYALAFKVPEAHERTHRAFCNEARAAIDKAEGAQGKEG